MCGLRQSDYGCALMSLRRSNRVGSPPTQPGGLLWLRERLGRFAVVLATTESCEERDSPGIRPCGVTPAWPLSWGAGPPLGYEAAPDRAVRRLNLGGQSARLQPR